MCSQKTNADRVLSSSLVLGEARRAQQVRFTLLRSVLRACSLNFGSHASSQPLQQNIVYADSCDGSFQLSSPAFAAIGAA